METVVILLLAVAMGLVSVEMFGKAWLGFLGLAAAFTLRAQKLIDSRSMLTRLHESLLRLLLCGGALTLAFTVYIRHLGLGFSEAEMMAYFIAAVARLALFLRTLSRDIDALFEPDRAP